MVLAAPLFGLRFLERLAAAERNEDAASSVFFFGRKSEHEMQPHQIVSYYR
jgi:hypothetical protein